MEKPGIFRSWRDAYEFLRQIVFVVGAVVSLVMGFLVLVEVAEPPSRSFTGALVLLLFANQLVEDIR